MKSIVVVIALLALVSQARAQNPVTVAAPLPAGTNVIGHIIVDSSPAIAITDTNLDTNLDIKLSTLLSALQAILAKAGKTQLVNALQAPIDPARESGNLQTLATTEPLIATSTAAAAATLTQVLTQLQTPTGRLPLPLCNPVLRVNCQPRGF